MTGRSKLGFLLGLALFLPVAAMGGGSVAQFVQEHCRWRNDDGSESAAGWKANQDTSITNVARKENIRLRFCIANTGAASGSLAARLEYATDTAGSWTAVSEASNGAFAFEMKSTTNYLCGAPSTTLLTGSGAFVAGKVMESPSNTSASVSISTNQYSNFEYCFQPTAKAAGGTSYFFRVSNDGAALSTYSQYAKLTIAPGDANEAPVITSPLSTTGSVASVLSYAIQAGGSEPITYGASNLPDGLTFDGVNVISGTPATPGTYNVPLTAANTWGLDSKTLVITVVDNMAPVASNQLINAWMGKELLINLAWGDADTPLLKDHTFTIHSAPSNGQIRAYGYSDYPNRYYYCSDSDFVGTDTFTWKCTDGNKESNIGTCSIAVSNRAPTAYAATTNLPGGIRREISFAGKYSDPDNPPGLNVIIVSAPSHGCLETLSPSPVVPGAVMPSVVSLYYTSDAGHIGGDAFTWKANDGQADSTTATYTLDVSGLVLSASARTVTCRKNSPLTISILPSGAAGYALTNTSPSHGTVAVSGGNLIYTPAAGYVGNDSFQHSIKVGATTKSAAISVVVRENADWPQWRADEYRKGIGGGNVPDDLHLQWRRDVPAPVQAWTSQEYMLFDLAYRPVVLGKTLFVGMSANDTLTAYDTDTGAQKWRFYSGSAVRCAPVAYGTGTTAKVCFGSDDGYLYCLKAMNGSLVWKHRAGPSDRKAMLSGRLGSVWPVRGGPVYHDGKIYFAAGLWTFEGQFMYCLDAETGAVVWKNRELSGNECGTPSGGGHTELMLGLCPQGQITFAYDNSRFFVPSSKHPAAIVDPATGVIANPGGLGCGWYVDGGGVAGTAEPMMITAGAREIDSSACAALGVAGTVGSILAGDDKLFVTTKQGSIYCFGGAQTNAPVYALPLSGLPEVADSWTTAVHNMLSRDDLKSGLALVWGVGTGRLVEELAKQAPGLLIVAADPDYAKLAAVRAKMDTAGLTYEKRVSVVHCSPMASGFAQWQAGLIASEDVTVAGFASGQAFAERSYKCLRPFGGEVWLPTTEGQHSAFAGCVIGNTNMPLCQVSRNGSFTQLKRTGMTEDQFTIRPPLGMLWCGANYWQGGSIMGRSGNQDIFTCLPLSGTAQGTEPAPPALNNAPSVDNGIWALNTFASTNRLYGFPQTRKVLWGYGCDTGVDYGDVHLERNGGFGVYDRSTDMGTLNIHDTRSVCSSASIFAGSGAISARGPGCACGYPLSGANIGLVSMPDAENWFEYDTYRVPWSSQFLDELAIRRIGINFGAPGDRYVQEEDVLWVHHPKTVLCDDSPDTPVIYRGNMKRFYNHSAWLEQPAGRDRRWVAASQVKGMTNISIRLAWPIVVLPAAQAPAIDGNLNDSCWNGKELVYLPSHEDHTVTLRYDENNLYIAGESPANTKAYIRVRLNSRDREWAGGSGRDPVPGDVMVGCGYGGVKSEGIDSNDWSCAWSIATGSPAVMEMAIPWAVLESAGLWKNQLAMNVNLGDQVLNGNDVDQAYYDVVSPHYSPVYLDVPKGLGAQGKAYNVKLYFAEMEDKAVGQRVFDVKMQGQTVLPDFDIAREAGGANRQVIKEFTDVIIKDNLNLDFVVKAGEAVISGAEITAIGADPTNSLPVAVIEKSAASGATPLAVMFSACGSSDPDGQIVDCRWDFGDGALKRGARLTHVFTEPGVYTVSLLVLDSRGGTGVATTTVTVNAGQPSAFVCSIRSSNGDYPKLSTWEAAIESDLTSKTTLFGVSSLGTYTNSDAGKGVTFTGGGTGILSYVDTTSLVARVVNCAGTRVAGTVTIAGGHTFEVSDTGTATTGLLFTLSSRGNYDPATDDGKAVTFSGGGAGTLKHVALAGVAYVAECRGAVSAGTVSIAGGHTFSVSSAGSPVHTAVAECYNDWPTTGLSDAVTVAGWRTDENHCVVIRAAAGHGHTGRIKDGPNYTGFTLKGANPGISALTTPYTRVERLIVDGRTVTLGVGGAISRIIAKTGAIRTGQDGTVASSLAIDGGFTVGGEKSAFLNCTSVDAATCFSYGSAVAWFVNCLARPAGGGKGFSSSGGGMQLSYCMSSDNTADDWDEWRSGQTCNRINQVFTFVNESADDFRLAASDVGARGCGAPGFGTLDIEGEMRAAPWDAGADQVPSATPIMPTITSSLNATGTVGQAFAYLITASGTLPITFGASGLPAGLIQSGAVISGTPASAGTNNVTLTAANNAGSASKTLVLIVNPAANQDANANGLPDAWETACFGSTSATNGAPNHDADGDGMNNAAEYVAGTNPRDAASALRVSSMSCDAGGVTGFSISFNTVTGRLYSALYCCNLVGGSWGILAPSNVPGTGGQVQITDTNKPAIGFYRLAVKFQ
ncbi:MAG: hypothetical protein C0404_10035 [Verrucomicrobia bacterium]|nr:hypothetical protein [Verrucomicrobiota bacterium]